MIKLEDVIESLELEFEEYKYYYHVASDSIIMLSNEEISYAEDGIDPKEAPEWQRENILLAYEFCESSYDEFIALPDRYDVNEYQMIENFIKTIKNGKIRGVLWNAIDGKGAFRRFKDALNYNGIQDDWYDYEAAQYKEIATLWCEANNIEYLNKE